MGNGLFLEVWNSLDIIPKDFLTSFDYFIPLCLFFGSLLGSIGMLRKISPRKLEYIFKAAFCDALKLFAINIISSIALYYLMIAVLSLLEDLSEQAVLQRMITVVFAATISFSPFGIESISSVLELEADSIPVVGQGLGIIIGFLGSFHPEIIRSIQAKLAIYKDRVAQVVRQRYPDLETLRKEILNRIRNWEPVEKREELETDFDPILNISDNSEQYDSLVTFAVEKVFAPSEIKIK